MKIKVKGQSLSIVDKYLTVSDTENVYEVEFEFGDAWDGFSKTACFKKDGGTTYSVVLDSTLKCRIPNEVVADSGYIYFGVLGTKTVGTETMRYPTIWTDRMFVDIGCVNGSTPTPPTPSVYAQILSAYETTNDRVDEVEDDIESLDTRVETAEGDIEVLGSAVEELDQDKQDTLVSGTNIKTINGNSILGAGNMVIGGAVDSVNGKTGVVVLDAEDVGALPDDTVIPTKTSQLQNDSGFLTQHQSLSAYRTASAQDLIDLGITNDIDAIEAKIPTQASSSNQLADKAFVNSSIATNTATFRGTSASGLTEAQFLAWANTLTHDDNDYVFWNTTDSDGNVIYKRYKYNGTEWLFEYALNNSSFTSAQWNAINSGITSDKVAEITANTNARHTHSNISILNGIIQSVVDAWNTASTWVSTNGANVISHLSNTIVHITSAERTAWNAKADTSDIPTKTSDLTNDSGFIDNTYHDSTKQNESDLSLQTTSKQIVDAINEVNSIALGANQALGVTNYQTLVTMMNSATATAYRVGQNIYVQTLNVPDVWVYSVESSNVPYTYTTDEALATALNSGAVQMGYYKISKLEGQKVDLTNYVTNTDYAGADIGGVVKTSTYYGTKMLNGILCGNTLTALQGDNNSLICKGTLTNIFTSKNINDVANETWTFTLADTTTVTKVVKVGN